MRSALRAELLVCLLVRALPRVDRNPPFAVGELIFMYRDGSSGSGNHIFNKYSTSTGTWSRLLGTPLTDGEG